MLASLELCSHAKALIAAPSGVTQLHHHRNCLRALFTKLFSSPQLCVGETWCSWSPCLRGNGAATLRVPPTLCRASFPRASGRRLHGVHLDRAPWPCSAVEFAWLARPFPLGLATCDSCSRRCITDQVPRGQRAPLDRFRLLLIDWSAELVESSLPVRGGTWCRSREHQSPAHSADSSRASCQGFLP